MGEGLFCDQVGAGAPAASQNFFGPLWCLLYTEALEG